MKKILFFTGCMVASSTSFIIAHAADNSARNAQTAYMESSTERSDVAVTSEEAEDRYMETYKGTAGFNFLGPQKDTPAEQLIHCEQLLADGLFADAATQYGKLAKTWPDSSEASTAQLKYGYLLDLAGNERSAFDAYAKMLQLYPAQAPYDTLLTRMFEIAQMYMNRRKFALAGFKGFAAPDEAVPLFEKIIELGPEWDRAPEAQYLIGVAYDRIHFYDDAIAAYTKTVYRYPKSVYAEKSSFAKAYNYYLLNKENPVDAATADMAWASFTYYIQTYPHSDRMEEAKMYRATLYEARAKSAYKEAEYYDRIARKPAAALLSYRRFLQQYPQSTMAEKVEKRVNELREKTEKKK